MQSPVNYLSSVTRLVDFWYFLVSYFLTTVAEMNVDFYGYFEKHHLLGKKCSGNRFGQLWGENWATLFQHRVTLQTT